MSEVRAATLALRRFHRAESRRMFALISSAPVRFALPAALPAALIAAALFPPAPACAQMDVLKPALDKMNGGAVWGAVGYRSTRAPGDVEDRRPIWRGGFGIFYGPFGGRSDTTISFTQTFTDSVDTTLCDPSQAP